MKNATAKTRAESPAPFRIEPLPNGAGGRPSINHDEMLAFVRRANGEWCRVRECDCYSTANQQAVRWRLAFGPQGYEFKLRRVAEGGKTVGVVYARFTGIGGQS